MSKKKQPKKKAEPTKIESEGETLLISENMEDLDLSSLVEEDEEDVDSYPDLGNHILNDGLSKIEVTFDIFKDVEVSGLLNKVNGISHTYVGKTDYSDKFNTELLVWFSVQNMTHFSSICCKGFRVKYNYLTYKSEWGRYGQLIEFKILEFEDGMVLCKILFNSVNS